MATEVRWRRGETSALQAFTPAQSEIIHNITTNRLHVGDGIKPGGHELALTSDIKVADFSDVNAVEVTPVPTDYTHLRTAGFNIVGDGGGALYKRSAVEPDHIAKFQSADGAWWELAATKVCPEMFGARADGVSDDAEYIQAAVDYMFDKPFGGEFSLLPGRDYAVGSTIRLIKEVNKQISINGNGARLTALNGFVGYNGVKDIIYAGASSEAVSGYPCIIKGVRFSSYEPFVNAIRLNWSGWSQVFQCAFDTLYNGVLLDNGFAVTIANNSFYSLQGNGIRAANLSMSVAIDKNRFAAIANGDIAFMDSARNISIRDNSMEGGTSALTFVGVSSSIIIEGNYIEGKSGNQIYFGSDTHGLVFNSNWLGYNEGLQEWVNIASGEMIGNTFLNQQQYMAPSVRNVDIAKNSFGEGSNIISSPFENAELSNGFVSSEGLAIVGYRLCSNGEVLLRGGVTGSANAVAFTLPAGMRPATLKAFLARGLDGSTGGVSISSSGLVTAFRATDGTIILDGIRFTVGS